MGMSTEDFEEQEIQTIVGLIKTHSTVDNMLFGTLFKSCEPSLALQTLIKILVSNGTLTSKQAERALKENK